MNDPVASATGQHVASSPDLGPPKARNRPYDNRPRSGPGRAGRRTPTDKNAVRVILPDEQPGLTPGAARALLRVLLKAHDELTDTGNPRGAAE